MTRSRYRFVGRSGADYLFVRSRPLDVLVTERFYHRVPVAEFWRVAS